MSSESMAVAPHTPLERWVASVWSEVIGTAVTRRTDSFTTLGGHSLHAVRITFLLRDSLGVKVPLAALFETADLADLCRFLQGEIDRGGVLVHLPDRVPPAGAGPAHDAVR